MSNITKNALSNSLKELLINNKINKITIDEIVKLTGVNRQTFYYHFNDIYDLVKWTYKNDIFKEIENSNKYYNWEELFELLLDLVIKNKVFIKKTYTVFSLNKFLYDFLYEQIKKFIEVNKYLKNEKDINFAAKFYSYAIIGIIYDWIKNDMKENKKEIINNITAIINFSNRQF